MVEYTFRGLNYARIKCGVIKNASSIAGWLAVLFILYFISLNDYVLFHSLAEIFSVVIAFSIFVIAWNSRNFLENDYLLFLGIAYLFIGGIDLLHIFAYKGLDIFLKADTNLDAQLWISARYLQAISLMIAPMLLNKKRIKPGSIFIVYFIIFFVIILSVFYLKIFPEAFVEGSGLTAFKKYSEYLISIVLFISLTLLQRNKKYFDENIFWLIFFSTVITILSELTFTLYVDPYGFANMVGHFLKILAFYLIYKALVEAGFKKPYDLMFRDLKHDQERYSSLIEYSPEAIGVYTNGEFVYMNPASLELFGARKPEDIIGKKTISFVHSDYRDSVGDYVQKLKQGERAEPLRDFKIISLDGKVKDVEAISTEITYEGKRSTQILFRDITERKSKEMELGRVNDFNQTLLNTIPFSIDIVNEQGDILFISKRLQKTFSPLITGEKCWNVYKDDKKQCMECPLKSDIKIGETSDMIVHGAFGGKVFRVVYTGMIFQGKKAVMEIFRDITHEIVSEKEIREARVYAESIVNTIRTPLVVMNSDFRVLSANSFFYFSFNFLKKETEGNIFFEIYGKYWNIPVLREKLEKLVRDNVQFHDLEIKHEFKAVGNRTMSFTARQIYQESGQEEHRFLLSIEDITEKRLAEEQVRQSEKKYRNIFDNASDAIITIDLKDNVTSWNKSAEKMFGWKKEEIVGKKFGKLVVPDRLKLERKTILENIFSGKSIVGVEAIRLKKDGSSINVSMTVSPIFNERSEIVGLSSIIRDITRQKEIDKAKTEFVSIASHELRTPLANMSLSVEMLLDSIAGPLNTEQKKYIKGIYQDIKGMAKLVDSLLNVSRIELGTMVVEPEPVSLREVAENVLKELSSQINNKSLDVKNSFDPALPIINTDRRLMNIILQNLITNSVKYTPAFGKIEIGITKEKNYAMIKISDTGCGIPKDQQNKIFQKLFRARNAIDQRKEGVGLGLYIVKSVVERCGGRIRFESEENKGTNFYVKVPLAGMRKQKTS